MSFGAKLYSLRSTLTISLVVKLSIFLIEVAIMGLLSTRKELTACSSTSPGSIQIFSAPLGDVEAYTDYRDLYMRCLVNPFLAGRAAYNLPIVYNYPPLFLYLLAGFALLSYAWTAGIPLVLLDALTAVPLYLIARDFLFKRNSRLAFAVSLIWIFNPLNLFYNDLMWLNPAATTFFVILAIYLLLKQDWTLSSIALAVATGLKQTAVLLFPFFLVWMLRQKGLPRRYVLAYTVIFVGVLVLISTPYIFQNPQNYFWSLQLPIFGIPPGGSGSNPTTFVYDLSQPTRLTTFLGLVAFVNLKPLAVATYAYLNYVFALVYALVLLQFGIGIRNLKSASLYFVWQCREVLRISVLRLASRFRRDLNPVWKFKDFPIVEQAPTANELLLYCLTALLLFFSLFGRGVYKYYFAGITPLSIPLFSTKGRAAIFIGFCSALILLPREVTPWMAVLLLTLIPQFFVMAPTDEPVQDQIIRENKIQP